jgi:beta-barrel assembly-enhancing protease
LSQNIFFASPTARSPITDHDDFASKLLRKRLSRRQVLALFGAAALSGCASSPVGGGSILVGMSEDEEKDVDRKVAPEQFSQDLGAVQDSRLNGYLSEIGHRLDAKTHRPQIHY